MVGHVEVDVDKINEIVQVIVQIIGQRFRSFGGGQEGSNNPVAEALKDGPLRFAAGVDIKAVVEAVLSEALKLWLKGGE